MPDSVRAVVHGKDRLLYFPGCAPVPADADALARARAALPRLRPEPLGLAPSFGFGDRIGLATPGHAASLHRTGGGIRPIFAQQSIREMVRTGRTPQEVMDDACFGALLAGYGGVVGADADHLKTVEDVERTAAAGFTFFTIDPSEDVDPHAGDYDEAELRHRCRNIRVEMPWLERYLSEETVTLLGGHRVEVTEETSLRAALKYGRALERAFRLGREIDRVMTAAGRPYEIELSVDETEQPTTLFEHLMIALECNENGLKLVSLAPRYVGDFEKGVDYKGGLRAFERSLAGHVAIAAMLGPYKLSLHSGSDKLSLYPTFARVTRGRFHVKTAGTSYLEAVRVAARHEPALFREIIRFARSRYDADRATYHVSARLDTVPPPDDLKPDELEQIYLERWSDVRPGAGFTAPGRQILHCTFGSVLNHTELGPALRSVLESHPATYAEVLEDHFARHLDALRF